MKYDNITDSIVINALVTDEAIPAICPIGSIASAWKLLNSEPIERKQIDNHSKNNQTEDEKNIV